MATTRQKWVAGGAVVVAIVLLYSAHNSQTTSGGSGTGAGASGPCTVMVTVDGLGVRSSPDNNAPVVQTYSKGQVVSADRTVRNGFRQLGPSRWAEREYLDPRPGSDCG